MLLLAIFIKFIDSNKIVEQKYIIEFVSKNIPHSIGYYSIALTFSFNFSFRILRPIWTVIVYDHNNPPKQKSIIEFDAFTKETVSEIYTEDIFDA